MEIAGIVIIVIVVISAFLWAFRKNKYQEDGGNDGNELLLNDKISEEMGKQEIKKTSESASAAAMRKFITNIKDQLESQGSAVVGVKDLPAIKKMLE